MRRAAFLLLQFFAGFGLFIVFQVAWLWIDLPHWAKHEKGDVIQIDVGFLAWIVTLGLFALCQAVAYWGLRCRGIR